MENIEETLSNLVQAVPGAAMAAFLGLDGVGVQIALSDAWKDMEQEVIELELAALAEAVQKAAHGLQAGPSPEFFLSTTQANFVGAMVNTAYFLVLGMQPDGDLGQAGDALGEAREALAG
jgi:predicted regulator of Ras-like GTPase activity (Roadblock/LC7/MglB family)